MTFLFPTREGCLLVAVLWFGPIAVIGAQDLEITSGKETLTTYQVSEHALKHFCRTEIDT